MFLKIILSLILFALISCSDNTKRISNQKLRLNCYCEPPSLDPRKCTDTISGNILKMLFEGLTYIDNDHEPKPAVAEEIHISEDKCTYTFKLRETYWSNGDRVTPEDFVYSWRKRLDPKFLSLFTYKLYVIKNAAEIKEGKVSIDELGVHILDDRTLQVTLNHPTPYFLELISFPWFYPIHKKTDEHYPNWADEAGDHYISNGPFSLKKWEHENEIQLVKNPRYWDVDSVRLTSIDLTMINDTTTEFYMYEKGELDWAGSPISNLPFELLPALKERGEVEIAPATAVYFYKINTNDPILSNQKIRLALGHCINRKAIVEHIIQGEQLPALGYIPPMPGWNMSSLYKDGDLENATALFKEGLAEMGIIKEHFPTITLSYNTSREHQKIAQAIQNQWKEGLGITVSLEACDWKTYLSKINRKDYQIGRTGWVADCHDPISFLKLFKHEDNPNLGGNNETGWKHSEYTLLLNQANKETNLIKRKKFLKKAEDLIISEMPIIPIFYMNYAYLKKPYVHGVFISSLGIVDFKKAYLK